MTTTNHPAIDWAHPLVREWFLAKYGAPTEPQREGWPAIVANKTTLISAPTGSGKTFTAFLAAIDVLVRKALSGDLKQQTEVVYVSPLKALSNDIHKNLTEPLAEITALAEQQGMTMMEIRIAVRTGDTLTRERVAMLKKPPHILVTTPESLYILLTSEKSRANLTHVKTLIIDEIHALANDKRGTHLSLSIERLQAINPRKIVRIGLSATQKPIETVAKFLSGKSRSKPVIVNIGYAKQLDLSVEIPAGELGAVASNEMWDEIYDRVAALANQNRSTLIFVNTRRLAERVAHHLSERLGEDSVAAHHGSLSRKLRLDAETRLKNGELKALVATASLELGIDIGSIDLVCQLGTPRAIAVALQRIGRAGHWHGAISKGKIFATTRDELLECAALIHAIREGDLDQLIIPKQPIDILAQQIVATCATGEWLEDDLFALVKQSFSFTDLSRETFDSVIKMLSEGIAGSRGRYGTYLFRDQVNGIVRGRRGSRLTAITSGGAIPDNGLFTVIAEPHGVMVGTLDEDFAVESNRGDIILLGTTSWLIRRIESAAGRVIVEDAHGAPPSVPFWRGEAPGRTKELSLRVSDFRQKVSDLLPLSLSPTQEVRSQPDTQEAVAWLMQNSGVDPSGAEQIIEYILQGRAVLGAVPSQHTVIAERFFDESGGMQLVIHAPFGARINKAWGLALRKKFCRSFNFELQASATDDGINIALAEQHSFPLADVFHFLHPNTIKEVLIQAVLQSPLFPIRWRWVATRSLALVRFRNGKKVPPNIQRMLSEDLLAAVFPDAAACQDNLGGRDVELPDHPLINETMKDALTEALDVEGLTQVLEKILSGEIRCLAVDTPVPSQFSHEILNANPYAFLDDAPLEERRARAVEMRRMLPQSVLEEVGKLDPAAIEEVQSQSWPDIRSDDELHDLLQSLIAFPLALPEVHPSSEVDSSSSAHPSSHGLSAGPREQATLWQTYFDKLNQSGRVTIANYDGQSYWVAAEKIKSFQAIFPDAVLQDKLIEIEKQPPTLDEALLALLRGWLLILGPTTADELTDSLHLKPNEVEQALFKLESTGFILRGQFRSMQSASLEWCERRLLARIHRLTVGRLRKEIEPVTAAQFIRWLLTWQHLSAGTQLRGEHGLLEVIRQLQGFELPANAWESQIFSKRLSDYDSQYLDRLCLSGVIGWGRLSPHAATTPESEEHTQDELSLNTKKRIMPTSIAPITFFVREESDWMPDFDRLTQTEDLTRLSHVAKNVLDYLKQRGASFFVDIVRGTGNLKSEVETGLWELTVAGIVTADGFDSLRAIIDPKRRLNKKRRLQRPRFSTGRWSLLEVHEIENQATKMEAVCWMLLKRYGVVFRDLVVREKNLPRWRELLLAFRRLEDRGEIRGGRFVSGFLGEQFALPYAVDSVRAMRNKESTATSIPLSAVDPLNLVGIILPGAKIPAISGKSLTLTL